MLKNRNLTDEDKNILARYNKIPDRTPDDNLGLGVGLGTGAILFLALGMIMLFGSHVENTRDELARDIIEIRDGELTCKQLIKQLGQSSINFNSYLRGEIYDRIEKDDCMSYKEIREHKRGDHCAKYNTMECRIHDIKNPPEPVVNRRGN
jgi:hypothetical protein